jgi:hypothetical protein
MLETIAIALIAMWALGMVGGVVLGGLIHVVLVVALFMLVIRLMQGRKIGDARSPSAQ